MKHLGEATVKKAVIFDMFETLITHYQSPLYFGVQMAEDAGIPKENFQPLWRSTEYARSIGEVTLEEVLQGIMQKYNCYSEQLLQKIVQKRIMTKKECFRHLHEEIVPMLSNLKKKGILIGLISNCFSEEAEVIRESELFPYFDAVYLSYEQGIQKPEKEIFQRCIKSLGVEAQECLYVGDGGSQELEAARELGMTAVQAVWYLKKGNIQPMERKNGFLQVESPLEILSFVKTSSHERNLQKNTRT